jgi:hypothetical protein
LVAAWDANWLSSRCRRSSVRDSKIARVIFDAYVAQR